MINSSFQMLPRHMFPIHMEALNRAGEVVWEETVTLPESELTSVEVPGLAKTHGPVGIRVTYGDGSVTEIDSDGNDVPH